MDPEEKERTPEKGDGPVFDNRFEAEAHQVISPDLSSRGVLCARYPLADL